ncbi:putative reverse transcriptase domain-containing protein [Tanacetum coccineum]
MEKGLLGLNGSTGTRRIKEMDVKGAFLYGKIEEEVYVCKPPGFEDPDFPNIVYKVEKALYGVHQTPRSWYETFSTYLLDNGLKRGKIDKTLFIRRVEIDILTASEAEGGWDFYQSRQVVMSSASSAVTYTSAYTDSEPGRPVAPPSPDYITGPEEPQTPPVPHDEDKCEPMFIQPHDPDYVPEPMYPEYIPLEDEHVFPAEEQPLPPVVSPTAESPGYVVESDPEEDPEEYEDDEIKDGPVDYPMDGGEDGDDDDGDSSGDDADDEDEEDEEEEEHLAPADSAVIVPTVELVSPPEGTEPVEVERLLAMPTPPPSPLTSLLPPSAGERLARCTAPSAHSSPPPVPSPLLPLSGCPTQIQTLRIASTQALVDAVTAALPSPPLPPLPPSLYIPPPVDRRDDVPESEQPPRKSSCLFALGSKYEVGGSLLPRATRDRGVDYGFVSTIYAEARTAGIMSWDDSLGDSMDGGGGGLCFLRGLGSLDRIESDDPSGASDPLCQAQMVETLRVIRDMRREMTNMQAKLLALREQQRRARQPGLEARILDHQDASRDADSHIQ